MRETVYLLQVRVGPGLPVGEGLGGDAAALVVLHAHGHGAPLDAHDVAPGGVGDIDADEAAAGGPEGGPARAVIVDAQRELPVVVVHLLRPRDPVEVQRQQVPVVDLSGGRDGDGGGVKIHKPIR